MGEEKRGDEAKMVRKSLRVVTVIFPACREKYGREELERMHERVEEERRKEGGGAGLG